MAIPVPNPKLRGFFRAASSARYTLGMIRTVEARCTSLFESNSELLIFSEDDLVRSLLKPLRTDEMLAGFGNRAQLRQAGAVDIKPDLAAEARARLNEISDHAGGRSTRDKSGRTCEDVFARTPGPFKSSSKLSTLHQVDFGIAEPQVATGESDAFAEAKTNSHRHESSTSDVVKEDVVPLRQTRERVSEHKTLSITPAQARDHFDKISDRACVRSSWDQFVIKGTGRGTQPLDPVLTCEVAVFASPNSLDDFACAEPNDEQSSASTFSAPAVRSAFVGTNTRIQSKVTHPSDIRTFEGGPAQNDEASPESSLDHILRPLVERAIHTRASLSPPKTSMREPPAASFPGSETEETNLTYEQPLTGLRRLAEMAVNVTDAGAVQRNQQTTADNERTQSGISELPVAHFARTEEAEFGAGLTDFLRQEMLRHGIGLESS